MIQVSKIPDVGFFRKKTGHHVYLKISTSAVKFYGLTAEDPDAVFGVGFNGNMTAVEPNTMVCEETIDGMVKNVEVLGESPKFRRCRSTMRARVLERGSEKRYAEFKCPDCDLVGTIDEDQYFGRVSILCPRCSFHGTRDFSKEEG